ncbi:hypothetical protein JD969_12995 [Planctomycetota bacterium]|nr:hypothetical protein JD969_12995 [Planctomycetota bacterium]
MRRACTLLMLFSISLITCGCISTTHQPTQSNEVKSQSINAEELINNWTFLGIGEVWSADNTIHLTETKNSKGTMLLSNAIYPRNVVLRYDIKPHNDQSVLVTLLGITASDSDKDLILPINYDGNISLWRTGSRNLFFAFHNASHNRKPFIRKKLEGSQTFRDAVLIENNNNVMTTKWHKVEVGRVKDRAWLKVDGKTILDYQGNDLGTAGRIALRIRGTANGLAGCSIKNLTIKTSNPNL